MGLIGTTVNGLATIRATGKEANIMGQMESLVETHTIAYFQFIGTARWFGSTLEWFTNIFITCLVVPLIISPPGEFLVSEPPGKPRAHVGN